MEDNMKPMNSGDQKQLLEEISLLKLQIESSEKENQENLEKYMNMCFDIEFNAKEEFELMQKEKDINYNKLQEMIGENAKYVIQVSQISQDLDYAKQEIKEMECIINELTQFKNEFVEKNDNSYPKTEDSSLEEEMFGLKSRIDSLQEQISSLQKLKVRLNRLK